MHYFSLLSFALMLVMLAVPRLYAPIVAGSATSTIQISSGADLRSSVVVDLDGGTLVIGDDVGVARTRASKNATLENATVKKGTVTVNGTTVTSATSIGSLTILSPLGSIVTAQPTSGVFNAFLDLNGQTATLNSPLEFNVGLWPFNGTIDGSKSTIKLNGPSVVTDPVTFVNAGGLNFTNAITLNDVWTFEGDGMLSGNGGVLDLSAGGALFLHPDTALTLNNFVLRGLGSSGNIIFSDRTSQLRLSNMQFELAANYTFTTGGVYVEGPTTIVTADKVLTFDSKSSLTVDGISLLYDTLTFADQQNIAPTMAADTNHKNCISLNNGLIRHIDDQSLGNVRYTLDANLSGLTVVHPYRQLLFDQSLTLNGQTFSLLFSQATAPLMTVAANKKVTLTNIKLEYFSPSYLSLGSNATIFFGDATRMTLAKDEDLSMSFTFRGACAINGAGHALTLKDAGALMVMGRKSSLLLENMTIKGLSGRQLRCMDNTCTVSLNNVKFELDGNYSLTTGSFVILR